MARLPINDGDDGTWGDILNTFLTVSHNSDGTLIGSAVSTAGAEMTANKGQANGYPGLDANGNINVIGRVIQVGPVNYDYTPSLSGGDASSAYVLIDKSNSGSDASLLYRDQGAIRAEIGLTTSDDTVHFKTVTGASGSEQFTDRFLIQATGECWTTGMLGVGTIPVEFFHISNASSSARILAKFENSNTSGGSSGAGLELTGQGVDWAIGTDAGLNGGNNFFIQDNNAGYPPRVLIDGSGNVAVGKDNATYKLDVAGDIASNSAGNGFRVKEGTNAKMGVATLVGGTATVANTSVTATSRVFLTIQAPGGTVGATYISARTAGTSFTITSTSGADTSTVAWLIVEPS